MDFVAYIAVMIFLFFAFYAPYKESNRVSLEMAGSAYPTVCRCRNKHSHDWLCPIMRERHDALRSFYGYRGYRGYGSRRE